MVASLRDGAIAPGPPMPRPPGPMVSWLIGVRLTATGAVGRQHSRRDPVAGGPQTALWTGPTRMIDPQILARVRSGVCAVGYLRVPLADYQRNTQSPFFQVMGTGFLVRGTTIITNRHVIEALGDEQARLGFPSSQLFLSFMVPDPSGGLRNTVRMIRHYGRISVRANKAVRLRLRAAQHLT